ncbi:DUF429 domain-containing protein [Fundidesulfovibrio terrae]|uniref:DUF429 domain-containing protein n=1 Tax=Fundidesulfovibrio terrae TaxID=2922866 RepID=UPI001FAEF0C2|nr:DUF429 domain-containing protein [Fundidesulfovibrio terrae]
MRVYGVDFTSAPCATKPLVVAEGELAGRELSISALRAVGGARAEDVFENLLCLLLDTGPVVAGFDFPFSQSHKMLSAANPVFSDLGWPACWEAFASRIAALRREEFVGLFEDYKRHRKAGDKQHKRAADARAKAQSPQTLYYTPVGKMYFEGVKVFLRGDFCVVPVRMNDSPVVAVEAYPGLFVRAIANGPGYKCENRKKMGPQLRRTRRERREAILGSMEGPHLRARYGFTATMAPEVRKAALDDDTGDSLDSLICAIQAAWAWSKRNENFGLPGPHFIDPAILAFEGWIMDPHCRVQD